MKDKLKEILEYRLEPGNEAEIEQRGIIVDELTVFMCYREVRAYYLAYVDFHVPCSDDELWDEIADTFQKDYPHEILYSAFEQVKKEMK